jgi:protein TonB
VSYPPALFDQKIEGDVLLRLYVDSTGKVTPESTKVIESSGYPALDSAALAGSRNLRYAPAKRRGIAVATPFVQPIEFRHPQGAAIRGGP